MSLTGLIDIVHWLEQVFERLGIRRSYGGALAYNYYGPPRLTQDIDVLVLLPDTRIQLLVEELAAKGCMHDDVAPRPIELQMVLDDLRGKTRLAAFLCGGIRLEMFAPWHQFHHRVLARSPERDLEGRRIRIHAPEDLIVFKKVFDRAKDIADIKAILLAQKGKLELSRLLADAQELLEESGLRELEALVREYGGPI